MCDINVRMRHKCARMKIAPPPLRSLRTPSALCVGFELSALCGLCVKSPACLEALLGSVVVHRPVTERNHCKNRSHGLRDGTMGVGAGPTSTAPG